MQSMGKGLYINRHIQSLNRLQQAVCTPELVSAAELAKFYPFTDYPKRLEQTVA
jgi:hypothetical protein